MAKLRSSNLHDFNRGLKFWHGFAQKLVGVQWKWRQMFDHTTCVISPWRAIPAPDRTSREAWRKTSLSQKQGIRLNIHVMVRFIQWHSEVKLSLDVFQTLFSPQKITLFYSPQPCLRVYYISNWALSPALFRDTEQTTSHFGSLSRRSPHFGRPSLR